MAPKSKLQQIADGMVETVRNAKLSKAWTMYTVPGGLEVYYSRDLDQDQVRLALRRADIPPCHDEIGTLASVFKVPPDTASNAYKRREEHPATKRKITYHVVELVWREYA